MLLAVPSRLEPERESRRGRSPHHEEIGIKDLEQLAILDQTSDAIIITDLEGKIVFWNRQAEELISLPREEALGKSIFDVVIPQIDMDKGMEIIDSFNEKGTWRGEIPFQSKGGQTFIASVTSTLLKNKDGEPIAIIGLGRDITKEKRIEDALKESERALRKSEAKFRQIFNSTNDPMFVVSLEARFIEVNDAATRQLGYSREELLTMGPADLDPPSFAAKIPDRIKETQEKGNLIFEAASITKDGRQIPVELSTRAIDYESRPAVLSVSRDIADRKRAEEALKESEEKFQAISEASPAAIFVYRGERVEYANQAALSISGYSQDELLSMSFVDIINPESRKLVREGIKERMAGNPDLARYRFGIITKSGEERWLDVSSGLITYLGSRAGIVICIDITDQKRMEEELKRSNADLQQFAYIASHDLKEPIRGISSFLNLLQKNYRNKVLDEKAQDYIGFAVDGATRMQQLINDILAYSRVETRGRQFANVNMNDAVAIALRDLRLSVQRNEASIMHDELPTIDGDKNQMVMLLENLIGNAIKFRGKNAPIIHISAKDGQSFWTFSVKDNGIGIEKKYQDRVFDMFERLHTRNEYEGTGIGLAIAKRIVERHRGKIWVESDLGKGTTFFFTIPKSKA